jgi:hypothetical protein
MKNTNVLKEINEMKYLFDYQRGRVISEQLNLNEVDPIGGAQDSTSTTTTTVAGAASTTTKTTRRATGLDVQKLLNTKFSSGLKEDGRVGPLTLGAIMNALEGSTGGSTGSSTEGSTTTTTTIAGQTTTTTTVAGGATNTAGGTSNMTASDTPPGRLTLG